ncbi:MAG: hypothetical protein QM765_41570 [Myxococcales bacterium]
MTNARARLLGLAACLSLPLLSTGCGEQPATESPDVGIVHPADAAKPAFDTGVPDTMDASATSEDAGTVAGDTGTTSTDAQLAATDGAMTAEDASASLPDTGIATTPDTGTVIEADAGSTSPDAGFVSCGRVAKSPDRPRKIVLAHPFTDDPANNNKAKVWDILDLSTTGEVTMPNPRVSFTMGRGSYGEVVFTPDGEIALAPQDDGTLGVLKFDAAGNVQVLHTHWTDGFWVDRLVMDSTGDRFYAVDGEWPNIGGGIYSVRIGCDGSLTNEGRILSAKSPAALVYLPGRAPQVFLFGKEVLTATPLAHAHLLDWGATPSLVASGTVFPDDDAIVSDARVMPDGQWLLLSDNSGFGTHRVAVAELQPSGIRAVQILTSFNDPAQVVPSPYGNAAIVVSGEGNSIHRLTFDPSSANAPFAVAGTIAYLGGTKPELPLVAVAMQSGNLFGRVYIAELSGIRQVQFEANGGVTDLGLTKFLTGFDGITGTMGVQP